MQGCVVAVLLLSLVFTEGFIFGPKNNCPIKKYKSSSYITGDPLLVHEKFVSRVDDVEKVARDCKVRVYVKGSYYQLANPTDQAPVVDADLVIGHAFKFELRDSSNALLCNKLCLSRNPLTIPEVKCFLQGIINRGLTWQSSNSDVISDNTYASNKQGWQDLKTSVQTACQSEKFKRQLLRALRRMQDEDEDEVEVEDEKKK